MNKAVIDLCKKVAENNLNINREDCREIDCSFEDCPFADGWLCILDYPERRLEIAKKYLKDNKIKVENKMEKTFREVIADIKEGEVWENSLRRIELLNGDIQISRINGKEFNTHILQFSKSITYKLKRNKYNFNEAFKAYEEGEEIESCENGYKYLQNTFTYPGNEQWLCFRNSEQMFTTDAIRGKWYIND